MTGKLFALLGEIKEEYHYIYESKLAAVNCLVNYRTDNSSEQILARELVDKIIKNNCDNPNRWQLHVQEDTVCCDYL